MQTLPHQAQQTINFHQAKLSPYMLPLGKAMAKTYLLPFATLLVVNVVINLLASQVAGLFTGFIGSAASLAIFVAVLYYGWRWAEGRWHGTSLFVEFTAVNKARRTLEAELNFANPKDGIIQQRMSEYTQLVDAFIKTMHGYGYIPGVSEIAQ